MRTVSLVTGTVALALALTACSTVEKPKPMATSEPLPAGKVAETAITVSATVEKIDLKKRRVTLRAPDGKSVTITVPPEVRNLAQTKVGDEVVVSYYEAIAYEVKKPGEASPGVTVAEDAARAKLGEKPAAYGASAVTVTMTIEAIDKKKPSVTLKGPEGDSVIVNVRNPANLERVKVGDLVEITYTEAMAVSVEAKD